MSENKAMTKRCSNCYKLNTGTNAFCSSCGFPLNSPDENVPNPVLGMPKTSPISSISPLGILLIAGLAALVLAATAWLVSSLNSNSAPVSESRSSAKPTEPPATSTDRPVLVLLPTVTPIPKTNSPTPAAQETNPPVITLITPALQNTSDNITPLATVTSRPAPTATVATRAATQNSGTDPSAKTNFSPYQLKGSYKRDDGVLYGRPEIALYGAGSDYNEGTVSLNIQSLPDRKIFLKLVGLDDELAPHCRMQVLINNTVIYDDVTTFPNVRSGDNGEGGASRYWDEMTITVPNSVLKAGINTLTLRNLTPWNGYLGVPYILINSLDFVSQD